MIWRSTRSRSVNGESLGGAEKAKFPKYGGKFEFTEHAFGADETRDSLPSPNLGGGITLHPVAAFCCARWRVNVVPGGGIDCIQHLDFIEIGRKLKERGYALRLIFLSRASSLSVATSVGTIAGERNPRPLAALTQNFLTDREFPTSITL